MIGREGKDELKEVRMEQKGMTRGKRKDVTRTSRLHSYFSLMGSQFSIIEVVVETKKYHKIVRKVSIFKVIFKIRS